MKVLYVSHTGLIAGGERSLLDTLGALPPDIEPVLATPPGPLMEASVVRTIEIPGVDATIGGSAFDGVRSVRRSARALRAVIHAERPQLVHANSIRAGLAACTESLEVPVVVSIRDRLPAGMRSVATKRLIRRRADLIVANSRHTASGFGDAERSEVIHPGVDLTQFEALPSVAEARARLGIGDAAPVLGIVAQLTPWKAQDDAIRILAGVRRRHPGAVLLIAGAATFSQASHDNDGFERSLHELAAELGVAEHVVFLGARDDVPVVLRALDVLLAPSWDEPFGRTIVEALAAGVPVAATNVGGPAEILIGTDGRLLPPRTPDAWIGPVCELLDSSSGADARRSAARAFSPARHVERLVEVYRSLGSTA